nr:uncharacterized protein LOC113712948 [Coffea arabica]
MRTRRLGMTWLTKRSTNAGGPFHSTPLEKTTCIEEKGFILGELNNNNEGRPNLKVKKCKIWRNTQTSGQYLIRIADSATALPHGSNQFSDSQWFNEEAIKVSALCRC